MPRHPVPLTTTMLLLAATGLAAADSVPAADPSVLLRIEALEGRIRELETAKPAPAANPWGGLTLGAYGEIKFGLLRNPDADGAWQSGFDGGRFTLMPSYRFSDRILFKAEVEFEHGGIALDADDKLGGAVEVEQLYLDFAFDEHLHWRAPGIDLVPFGYTNLMHEPTLFYSVERPELAERLVPTTWFAGATSIHGVLAGPVSYQFQISTSLVDDGGAPGDRSDAGTPPDPTGYPAGIDGAEGLGLARATTGDFAQVSDTLAYALRLAYGVPAVRGLDGSTSVYYTPDLAPRGAYASDASNVKLGELGSCSLAMLDSELRYRPGDQGLELRGEGVISRFGNPANLRANNDGDPENNVGRTMWGFSAEAAWHWRPSATAWEVVPFYRYTREVLQTAGVDGLDADAPTGSGDVQYHTLGIAAFPTPQVVLKLDYRATRDGNDGSLRSDHVLGGVGFLF